MPNNKKYILYAGKVKVTVSCDVYKAYFSELDKERYINKCALKNEISLEPGETNKDVSYPERVIEEHLIDKEVHKALSKALSQLSEEECRLLNDIYYLGISERSAAQQRGIHYMTLHCRKQRILEKLRKMME